MLLPPLFLVLVFGMREESSQIGLQILFSPLILFVDFLKFFCKAAEVLTWWQAIPAMVIMSGGVLWYRLASLAVERDNRSLPAGAEIAVHEFGEWRFARDRLGGGGRVQGGDTVIVGDGIV